MVGQIGYKLKEKLRRITSLDPARPLYDVNPINTLNTAIKSLYWVWLDLNDCQLMPILLWKCIDSGS